MAQSKRGGSAKPALDDEAQKRRDRIILWAFLVGGVLIVLGMIAIAQFLSGK